MHLLISKRKAMPVGLYRINTHRVVQRSATNMSHITPDTDVYKCSNAPNE